MLPLRWSWGDLRDAALPALTLLFGLQLLRNLLTGLVFYLRDASGVATTTVGLYAFALFLVIFLATLLHRLLGPQRAVVLMAGGVGLVRAIDQIVSSPLAHLVLATLGTALFLLFIPVYAGHLQGRGTRAGGLFGLGLLLGIGGDTAIKGTLATLDLSWHQDAWALALVTLLAGLQWLLLWRTLRPPLPPRASQGCGTSLPLVALGSVLVLEMLLFQNIGQQTVLTGWSQPAVFAWIVLANGIGIAAGAAAITWREATTLPLMVIVGALLVAAVVQQQSSSLAILIILVGQVAVGLSVAVIGMALGSGLRRGGMAAPTVAAGLGMMLVMILLFTYYSSYELSVPLPRSGIAPLAAGVVLLSALVATRALAHARPKLILPWAPVLTAFVLLILPGVYWLGWEEPAARPGTGFPVRVMSYNLHQGFDTSGRLDLEALATVIEREEPDIVALQEVSRGWAIDGSLDMLVWLSQRLKMPYVWGPAADSVWGNAILSRYPMSEAETHPMPNNAELRLKRAFTSAAVDIGAGQTLRVIATHLHNVEAEGARRVSQVEALLAFWNGGPRTVIMGDLNAVPESPEMQLLRDAGTLDAFLASSAQGTGFTSRSDDPFQRIDYIWLSPDLSASAFTIPDSQASDHLPVAVTVVR